MWLKDNKTGNFYQQDDVLGLEKVAAGIAKRALRRPQDSAGASVAQEMDPNQVVVTVPPNQTH